MAMNSRGYLVAATVALFIAAGCGGEKKQAPAPKETASKAAPAAGDAEALPEGHPTMSKSMEGINKAQHATIKTNKEIVLSDEVKAKWIGADLEITDNKINASKTMDLKVGATVKLNDEGHNLKIEAVVPDYTVRGNRIETRTNDANNPAVLVVLTNGEATVARGWVFKDYPAYNSFADYRFQLVLKSVKAKKK